MISGYSQPVSFRKIEAAPIGLRTRLLQLIEGETLRSEQGQPAKIMARINSLVDEEIITALYRASLAGVKIQLNVRGACCLRAGVAGQSENIEVTSIVDRFLEHSRLLYFHHGGEPQVFISSADWMPRNLDRRVELLVPVDDEDASKKIIDNFGIIFRDNVKARKMKNDGSYELVKPGRGAKPLRSQEWFYQQACEANRQAKSAQPVVFEPERPSAIVKP
jgi:polyphosphate kinase